MLLNQIVLDSCLLYICNKILCLSSAFSKIRVIADERIGSATGITIHLIISLPNERIGELDLLELTPESSVTRAYDIPGTGLTILVEAAAGTGSDGVDVYIFGS